MRIKSLMYRSDGGFFLIVEVIFDEQCDVRSKPNMTVSSWRFRLDLRGGISRSVVPLQHFPQTFSPI